MTMNHDISQSVPQGSDGAQEAENCRIAAIANELKRLCTVYEAQRGAGKADVTPFETEQRVAEQYAKKLVMERNADSTAMTKEEFFARVDESLEQARQGRVHRIESKEDLHQFLNSL